MKEYLLIPRADYENAPANYKTANVADITHTSIITPSDPFPERGAAARLRKTGIEAGNILENKNLSPEFVLKLYSFLTNHSQNIEKKILTTVKI